jgi:uncharacterized membrane protein YgcG
LLLVVVSVLVLALGASRAAAADGFGEPVLGQHVYDRAGILTPAEVQDLEARAAAVGRAGAPTVVYLRRQEASQSQTERDGRDLMELWGIESAPGARDGLVIFLNLEPGDPRHGAAALYAGQRHVRSGIFTERALQRLFDREMQPLLAEGRTAAGIAAGLDAAAAALVAGPPAPSPLERTAGDLARLPLNLLAAAAALLLALRTARAWRARPTAPPSAPTTVPPERLAPPLAGALVSGRVGDAQVEAALLDLAQRGALVIEPVGRKEVQLRLVDHGLVRTTLDQAVWRGLAAAAGPDGVVPPRDLGKIRRSWGDARRALRDDLETRGWYDPRVGERRRPLYLGGALALAGAAVGLVVAAVGGEPLGLFGPALLGAVGAAALTTGGLLPSTTTEGAWKAAAWQGYRAGLQEARRVPEPLFDLDEALPYAVAMGSTGALKRHLQTASERGYAPAWFVRDAPTAASADPGFYVYWAGLHASVGPSTSSGTTSGASTGGASAGGNF